MVVVDSCSMHGAEVETQACGGWNGKWEKSSGTYARTHSWKPPFTRVVDTTNARGVLPPRAQAASIAAWQSHKFQWMVNASFLPLCRHNNFRPPLRRE